MRHKLRCDKLLRFDFVARQMLPGQRRRDALIASRHNRKNKGAASSSTEHLEEFLQTCATSAE
jgi:hypothetical protein